MTLELIRSSHPYFQDVGFTAAEAKAFPAYRHCPACGTGEEPEALVELGAEEGAVAFVQCRECDHLYYRNPPPQDFFARFYRETWNATRGEGAKDAPAAAAAPKPFAAKLAAALGLKPPSPAILEIGCGTGAMLLGLRDQGFTDLRGTEASDFRARSTAQHFPNRIYAGGYEAVPDEHRFDFIYSHHVVEHVYDPYSAFAWMHAHLKPQGIIVITVPDAWSEPVLNQLLFLPHLHSFCHRSLMKMGEAYDYTCRFWKRAKTPHEICAVFFRGAPPAGFDATQFTDAALSPDTATRRQASRIARLFDLGRDHRYFALHAGESGTVAMREEGGVRALGPVQINLARIGVPLGRMLAGAGLRKLGNKRLGRLRFIECRARDGGNRIVDAKGRAPFHIK